MHGGSVVGNVIESVSGVIVFPIQVWKLKFKLPLEYDFAERLMVPKELVTVEKFGLFYERKKLCCHRRYTFAGYGEIEKQGANLVLPLHYEIDLLE